MISNPRLTAKTVAAGILGFASALPFVFLTGSLAAWYSELGMSMTTIGLLSSITLAYGFKLLWSPLVRRALHRWMALCQFGLALAFVALAKIDPLGALSQFALIGFIAALLSATHDTAFEAWRIRVADAEAPVEVIMTASQIGARVAVLVAGAGALWFSTLVGWAFVALALAGIFALVGALILIWPVVRMEDDLSHLRPTLGGQRVGQQLIALICAIAGLAIAMWQVVGFIAQISAASGDQQSQVDAFTRFNGPLIIAMVTIVPILASRLGKSAGGYIIRWTPTAQQARLVEELYEAVVAPFEELADRFGVRIFVLLLFVSFYTLTWFSWAGFTLPFYMRELGFTKAEVALAARLYGSLPTALGILLGGLALVTLPRRWALLIGALLPLIANGVYIDLAKGGTGLSWVVNFASNNLPSQSADDVQRLGPLYLAITLKNLCSGAASAIFVGFLASLVNRRYATAQCAIFSSLSFVIGAIVSAMTGSLIDEVGFARMLEYASGCAIVAAILSFALTGAFKSDVQESRTHTRNQDY